VNGQGLLALGCADGVWIGFRHDPTCEIYFHPPSKPIYLQRIFSDPACPPIEDGLSVCCIGIIRNISGLGWQGIEAFALENNCAYDVSVFSRYLPTMLKPWYDPSHPFKCPKYPINSTANTTYIPLISDPCKGEC